MKTGLLAILGAINLLIISGAAQASDAPIIIRELRVYQLLRVMNALNARDEATVRKLVNLVTADGKIDPDEQRLIDAFSQDHFDVVVVPAPGITSRPSELRFSGQLSGGARDALKETGPLDYRAVIDNPDLKSMRRLVSFMDSSPSQRAAATDYMVNTLKAARTKRPQHANGKWGYYRELVSKFGDLLLPSRDPVIQQARVWFFQAAMIDDREAGEDVPDFLYSWMLKTEEQQLRSKAMAELEEMLKKRAAR